MFEEVLGLVGVGQQVHHLRLKVFVTNALPDHKGSAVRWLLVAGGCKQQFDTLHRSGVMGISLGLAVSPTVCPTHVSATRR